MTMKTTTFNRKPLAAAVIGSVLGLSPMAYSATVDSVNTDNLSVPPVDGKTLVYTDTDGTASFGWIDPVNDSGVIGLGISVYNEAFSVQQGAYDFDGCIMAQPDRQNIDPSFVNCLAPGDSGKRFKLKSTETNGPIDLVFNITVDGTTKLYRVIGKLSNLTDPLNTAGGDLKGFRFETGFGVGNDFVPSTAADGLTFPRTNDDASKLSIGSLGKYPGGLFGGSKVEGLPFFSTSIAAFSESNATDLDADMIETDGTVPAPYAALFGNWRNLQKAPTGWFIDHDGNPANDSILLAWNDGTASAPDWQTYQKNFDGPDVDTDGDGNPDTPVSHWDPNDTTNFDTTVAGDVTPLVDTLGESDPEDLIPDAISLTQKAASTLYDGTFKVLIDGNAVQIAQFADWANTPPTVVDSSNGNALYATWYPDEGEDGMYQLASDSSWVSLTDMNAQISSSGGTLVRKAGYVQGPVEDLANVNINTTVSVANTSAWPTCTSDGTQMHCTFTLRVTGLNDAVAQPTIPATPVAAAAPSEGRGTTFGCTAGKPGAPFDPVLPGMVLMAMAGLWARKRLASA